MVCIAEHYGDDPARRLAAAINLLRGSRARIAWPVGLAITPSHGFGKGAPVTLMRRAYR